MDVKAFFLHYVEHLRERSPSLRYLAVSAASEYWLAFEAAVMIDAMRPELELDECLDTGDGIRAPRWLVIPEKRKVDLSVIDLLETECGEAFEFKLVHNNKNLAAKVAELRRDVARETPFAARQWGLLVYMHLVFADDHWGQYRPLGGRSRPKGLREAHRLVHQAMSEPGEAPPLRWEVAPVPVCDLEGANYVRPGSESGVWVGLVRSSR